MNKLPQNLFSKGFIDDRTQAVYPLDMTIVNWLRAHIAQHWTKSLPTDTPIDISQISGEITKISAKPISKGEIMAAFILEGFEYKRIKTSKNVLFKAQLIA